jgi:hypothetical protein
MAYQRPIEEDPGFMYFCCELCGSFAPTDLGVIRFSKTLHRDTLRNPEVTFYMHLVRRYAHMTRFINS